MAADFTDIFEDCFNNPNRKEEFDLDFELGITKKPVGFDRIEGMDDQKKLVARTMQTAESFNTLFIGPPGSAKSTFLEVIQEMYGKFTLYADAANATVELLYEIAAEKPKIILIDEIEKMNRNYQEKFLTFAQTGRIKIDKVGKHVDVQIQGVKIYATANDITRITPPLHSRFRKIWVPKYTEENLIAIAAKQFPHLKASNVSEFVARCVWRLGGDIRDLISYCKLVTGNMKPADIHQMIQEFASCSEPTLTVEKAKKEDTKKLEADLDEADRVAEEMLKQHQPQQQVQEPPRPKNYRRVPCPKCGAEVTQKNLPRHLRGGGCTPK